MLRPVVARDLPALVTLHASCFAAGWSAASLVRLWECGAAGWLVEGPGPQAFILWRDAADEREILTLATLPQWRGRGLAGQLVRQACQAGRTVFLDVRESNHVAQRVYQREGFAVIARRPGYYAAESADSGAECALVMRWTAG